MQAMKYSLQTREVLLKWRGQVPVKYCEIVNDINGEVLGNLADVLAYVSKEGKSVINTALVGEAREAARQWMLPGEGSQPSHVKREADVSASHQIPSMPTRPPPGAEPAPKISASRPRPDMSLRWTMEDGRWKMEDGNRTCEDGR